VVQLLGVFAELEAEMTQQRAREGTKTSMEREFELECSLQDPYRSTTTSASSLFL
jgi:hypothetical protein